MASEREHRLQRSLQAMISDVVQPQTPLAEPLPDEVEDLLWDYAQGLLEPAQEARVIRLLAGGPRAEAALARIRSSMVEAGVALPIEPELSVLELARQRAVVVFAAMGREPFLAAVIVNLSDGLVAAVGPAIVRPTLHTLRAAPALALGEDEEEAERRLQRVDVPEVNGVGATVLRVSNKRTDIVVATSKPEATGRVRLLKVEQVGDEVTERDTAIDAYLESGRCTLEDCPTGVLRIVVPDGRDLLISLEAAEP